MFGILSIQRRVWGQDFLLVMKHKCLCLAYQVATERHQKDLDNKSIYKSDFSENREIINQKVKYLDSSRLLF